MEVNGNKFESGADLKGANLKGANLKGAAMTVAVLTIIDTHLRIVMIRASLCR